MVRGVGLEEKLMTQYSRCNVCLCFETGSSLLRTANVSVRGRELKQVGEKN